MKRPNPQHASAYTVRWHYPTDARMVPVGSAAFPRTGIADVLMQVENLLGDGYGVVITPPPMTVKPVTVEIVDLEVVA